MFFGRFPGEKQGGVDKLMFVWYNTFTEPEQKFASRGIHRGFPLNGGRVRQKSRALLNRYIPKRTNVRKRRK